MKTFIGLARTLDRSAMGHQHKNRLTARCQRRRLQSSRLHPPESRRRFGRQPASPQLPKAFPQCSTSFLCCRPPKFKQIHTIPQESLCRQFIRVFGGHGAGYDVQWETGRDSFGVCTVEYCGMVVAGVATLQGNATVGGEGSFFSADFVE